MGSGGKAEFHPSKYNLGGSGYGLNQVSRIAEAAVAIGSCRPSQNSSIIFLLKAGISSGLRLVTNPLSTTTSSLIHFAPALRRSALIAGQDVMVLSLTKLALMSTCGPCQMAATGLPSRKKWRVNS